MSLKRPHPLIRLALFGALYLCGASALQGAALAVTLAASATAGADASPLLASLEAGNFPPAALAPGAWLGLFSAVGLAALFHAWGGEDPLHGLRTSWRALGRDTLLGLALGLGSLGLAAAVFGAFGWAEWSRQGEPGVCLIGLALSAAALLPAAAAEEVVFRGYLLRTLEGWRGWPLALTASSVLFGLAHGLNPNVTPLALLNVALAGAAFALAWRVTRTLWLPIAYHFMWNFAQGPLLGFPVSGLDFGAGVRATVSGPSLLTGGAFGPEGGLAATLLLLASCWALWRRARR